MIHMRPYNALETENVKILVDRQIDFATIQITETGLKKSILDATAPVRSYLKESGLHDYELQIQGSEHKRLIETYILTETEQFRTQTSLYRPVTKKGDPRLWVNRLKSLESLKANDIFALIVFRGILYVFNLTSVDLGNAVRSPIETPLKDLLMALTALKNEVSEELLQMIRDRMTEWIPTEVMADTGVGRTVEKLLGIDMNASKDPDYKGIELKSHRSYSQVRNALFTQTPDWSISKFKSGREIVNAYGYIPKGLNSKTLQVTLSSIKPNNQNLGLKVDLTNQLLEADEFCLISNENVEYKKLQDVAAWKLEKLHQRLLSKHRETFWIDVETAIIGGHEYFRCSEIIHTKNPIPSQFDILLEQGQITVDLLLCRPSGHGDTYSFKIRKAARPLLFPESETHKLVND